MVQISSVLIRETRVYPCPDFKLSGSQPRNLERAFNRRVGFGPADDRIPEWMTREPLLPHHTVFDVPPDELDGIFADLT